MSYMPDGVLSATLKDLKTGQIYTLITRPSKYCHFSDKILCGVYEIGMRIDWKAIDVNDYPTLDIDFFKPGQTKPIQEMRNQKMHHTHRTPNEIGEWVYQFNFDTLNMELLLTLTRENTLSIDCILA